MDTQKKDTICNDFKYVFRKGDHRGEVYDIHMKVPCVNPVCLCSNVLFEAVNMSRDSVIKYSFMLDVECREISEKNRKDLSRIHLNFVQSFIADLDDRYWKKFIEYFVSIKTELTRNINNWDEVAANFYHEGIENEGLMYSYRGILPFSESITFFCNGKEYFVEDQYCLKSSCPCTNALLIFYERKNQNVIINDFSPAVFLDYKTKKWKIESNPFENSEQLDGLIYELLKSVPHIFSLIKQRHKISRKLYGNFRNRQFPETIPVVEKSVKPGRNDPCPCGSGKKYKKCCGY